MRSCAINNYNVSVSSDCLDNVKATSLQFARSLQTAMENVWLAIMLQLAYNGTY